MIDLDQYYTCGKLAAALLSSLQDWDDDRTTWVEPSAGTGAFFNHLPPDRRIGYDLDPHCAGCLKGNFLDSSPPPGRWIAVGNPPFGKNASTAVRFFNHCSGAALIAMIVPRTFRKASLINRLDASYHCIHDETLPAFSFIFEQSPYDVPCCFQVWQQRSEPRPVIVLPKSHSDFAFVKRHDGDFAVQRVGVRAGAVKDISDRIADASHYFIRGTAAVRARFEQINYEEVKFNTAGNPSIGKAEIVSLYSGII